MGCGSGGGVNGTDGGARQNRPQNQPPPRQDSNLGNYTNTVRLSQIESSASQFLSIIRPPVQSIDLLFYSRGLRLEITDSLAQSEGIVVADFVSTDGCKKHRMGNQEVALAVLGGFAGDTNYILFKNTGESTWKNLGTLSQAPPSGCIPYNLNGGELNHNIF